MSNHFFLRKSSQHFLRWIQICFAGGIFFASGVWASEIPVVVGTSPEMNGIQFSQYQGFDSTWKMVTVRYRKDTSELRFVYANPIAWEALQKKVTDYPDGAVFGKVGYGTEDDPAFVSSAVPAGARRFQLMVRNKAKYKDTNGWGYALFNNNGLAGGAEDFKTQAIACNACHNIVPERGYVFSVPAFNVMTPASANPQAPASGLIFRGGTVDELPQKLSKTLPSSIHDVRFLTGQLQANLFQGTLDEIRPSLANEVVRSNLPAALVSTDQNSFVLVLKSGTDKSCQKKGMLDLRAISTFKRKQGDDSHASLNAYNFCWKAAL